MEKFMPWGRKTIGGIKVLMKPYKNNRFQECFQLFKKSTLDSKGMGQSEFDKPDDLQKYLAKSKMTFTYDDEGRNNKLIAFGMVYDTPLSRSTVPLLGAGYAAVDKDYRGKGIYSEIYNLLIYGMEHSLCPGHMSRNALTALTALHNIKMGSTFTGVIPKSINIPKLGWLVDLTPYLLNDFQDEENIQKVAFFTLFNNHSNKQSFVRAGSSVQIILCCHICVRSVLPVVLAFI